MSLSMLKDDFAYGLGLLREILERATFNAESIEKVREQICSDIKSFWDEPSSFVGQLVRNVIYKGHPYSKDVQGCRDSVMSITRDDIVRCYKKCITPDGMRIAVVGDLEGIDVERRIVDALGSWHGVRAEETAFPPLGNIRPRTIDYPINRDQVVLCIAGLSVSRTDDDFDKLYLFDQIFGSGVLGSMASRLFQLREQSGIFYTVHGGVTVQSNEQPGMVYIKTIVSLDRLEEAQKLLHNTIDTVADSIEDYELQEAKRAVLNALIDNFETNLDTAKSLIFIDKYHFSDDYFDVRAAMLEPITVGEVQQAVRRVLRNDRLITVRVGRV
jgi:zinc protease